MKKNKLIALALSFCLTLGLVPSIFASAAVKDTSTTIESVQAIENNKTDDTVPTKPNTMETAGIKSKAVLKISKMLVKNTNKLIGVLNKAGVLDDSAALALGANFYKISNFLDKAATYGDDAAAYVRSYLPSQLISWGVESGTSEMIANALSWAIKGANWIFL